MSVLKGAGVMDKKAKDNQADEAKKNKGRFVLNLTIIAAVAGLVVLFVKQMNKINEALDINTVKYEAGLSDQSVTGTQATAPFIALVFIVVVTVIITASFAYRKQLREKSLDRDHISVMEGPVMDKRK